MECKKVIEILEKQSPKSYACDWDNVGLLVGREDKEIQKIYIALDATDEAIEEDCQWSGYAVDPSSDDIQRDETGNTGRFYRKKDYPSDPK